MTDQHQDQDEVPAPPCITITFHGQGSAEHSIQATGDVTPAQVCAQLVQADAFRQAQRQGLIQDVARGLTLERGGRA